MVGLGTEGVGSELKRRLIAILDSDPTRKRVGSLVLDHHNLDSASTASAVDKDLASIAEHGGPEGGEHQDVSGEGSVKISDTKSSMSTRSHTRTHSVNNPNNLFLSFFFFNVWLEM